MRISREWATPLTIGVFGIMAVTGVLLFFHLDAGLNKVAHEWLGWAMIAGAAAHVAANWLPFKRYLLSSNLARGIVGASVVVLAASFVSPPGGKARMSPPVMAMKAVARAPISTVAPLAGRTAEQLVADLGKAGIAVPNASASLESVIGGNRELEGRAMRTLFGQR